jgi:acetoacetate decarboxylase
MRQVCIGFSRETEAGNAISVGFMGESLDFFFCLFVSGAQRLILSFELHLSLLDFHEHPTTSNQRFYSVIK